MKGEEEGIRGASVRQRKKDRERRVGNGMDRPTGVGSQRMDRAEDWRRVGLEFTRGEIEYWRNREEQHSSRSSNSRSSSRTGLRWTVWRWSDMVDTNNRLALCCAVVLGRSVAVVGRIGLSRLS